MSRTQAGWLVVTFCADGETCVAMSSSIFGKVIRHGRSWRECRELETTGLWVGENLQRLGNGGYIRGTGEAVAACGDWGTVTLGSRSSRATSGVQDHMGDKSHAESGL